MKITRVFQDVDLRCAFHGLRAIAKRAGTDESSNVVFINRTRTAFKVLTGNKYLVCYSNENRRIPVEVIWQLPEHFGGEPYVVDAMIRDKISKALAKKGIYSDK